jgi:phosphocarrier protein
MTAEPDRPVAAAATTEGAAGACGRAGAARRTARICNQRGLHARAAARFVKTAAQFDAEIWVRKNGTAVSGRSIMGLMMLAAASGSDIEITATGRDAAMAVEMLARLIECKFNED